jgi:hypothetical protein
VTSLVRKVGGGSPIPNRSVHVAESADLLTLANDLVEFGFSRSDGGALVSIVDRLTGYQFVRDCAAPRLLWRLALRRAGSGGLDWLDSSQAERFDWDCDEDDEGSTLVLTASGFGERALEVEVRVRLEADSSLSHWRVTVRNVGDSSVYQLTCPILSGLVKVGEPEAGEAIVFPRQGEGYLFRDPYPVRDRLPLCAGPGPGSPDVGIGVLHGLYPGAIPLQMCAYYNDQAGLYLATHDASQNVKSFDVAPLADRGSSPAFSISHFPGEQPGQDVTLEYDTVVGVFHGDWCDAADVYKAWGTKQWWCRRKLWERDDLPDWMRTGFGVFQTSNYWIPKLELSHSLTQTVETVNGLSRETGTPFLTLVFNYEQGGAWTGPKGLFPPREGEAAFREAMARLREAGNHGFVYMPGGCWYLKLPYDPPFDSWEDFEAEARPHAIKGADGQIPVGRWYPGWESTRLCPQPDYTRELTASVLLQCLDLGCTVVQIDNFPCGGSEACYDPSHGHPVGYGSWWSEAWARILAETRRRAKAVDPNCALATEGISENFLPYLDLFDHRSGNMEYFGHYSRGMPHGGETIPLFTYVYGEYLGAYLAAMPELNRPEVLYWTRCFGKALTEGVVPTGGHYFPEPKDLDPVTLGFFKKVVRAAAQECWPYLMFGEMLRPPKIEVPTVTASYCKFVLTEAAHFVDPKQRHEVKDRAVQTAAWRGRDASVCLVFVNISEEPVGFDIELSGTEAPTHDVERFTDGARDDWLTAVALPRRERLKMDPLSVVVLIARPHHQ